MVFDVDWLIDPIRAAAPDGAIDWSAFRDTWLHSLRVLLATGCPRRSSERGLYLSRQLDTFTDAQATVEAFASTPCRRDLAKLIETLRSSGVKDLLGNRVDRYRNQMLKVPMSGVDDTQQMLAEMRERNRYRELIEEAEQMAVADFDPNLPDIRAQAQLVLDSARESVRRPKD